MHKACWLCSRRIRSLEGRGTGRRPPVCLGSWEQGAPRGPRRGDAGRELHQLKPRPAPLAPQEGHPEEPEAEEQVHEQPPQQQEEY